MPSILGWGRATQALGSMSSLLGEGYSGPGFNARSIVESTQALGLMHAKSIGLGEGYSGPGFNACQVYWARGEGDYSGPGFNVRSIVGSTQALGLMSGLLLGLPRPWV